MSPARPATTAWTTRRLIIAGVGVAGLSLIIDAKWGEPNWVRVARLHIPIPGWPRSAAGLRIGQISDLHCDNPADSRRVAHAARLLMSEKPDVVFVTGDYLTTHPVQPKVDNCLAGLRPLLAAPLGAYAILGNHDYWSGGAETIVRQMTREGYHFLRNRSHPLKGVPNVWVVGLDDRFESMEDVAAALKHVPEDAIKLLLVHEPDYADEAPPGFSLQFSGHSHGGQIRIPGLPPLDLPYLGRKYYEGLRQAANHPVYVTRGVGMVNPKVRLFCPPEVALITVGPA